ncbi:hypothetical protein C8J57DRAFT_1210697 [Mycena rebaudengoi]|nr:hypothetical protein C8J57DRAFT_1210697 [Mycena rebaudengoi]
MDKAEYASPSTEADWPELDILLSPAVDGLEDIHIHTEYPLDVGLIRSLLPSVGEKIVNIIGENRGETAKFMAELSFGSDVRTTQRAKSNVSSNLSTIIYFILGKSICEELKNLYGVPSKETHSRKSVTNSAEHTRLQIIILTCQCAVPPVNL